MNTIEYTEVIDISLPFEKDMVTLPNHPGFNMTRVKGSASLLHKFSMGTHTGTHIDAPNHVIEEAPGVDFFPLTDFLGTCRVLDCTDAVGVIELEHVKDAVIKKGERILLKTKNSDSDPEKLDEMFVALSPAAAEHIASHDISLVGIDSLSIRGIDASEDTAHTAFSSRGIPILEGITLHDVQPGLYTLVAFPLKFAGVDGAPIRAVLLR